jgi:uncharacterized RDD family membrane protein YckC
MSDDNPYQAPETISDAPPAGAREVAREQSLVPRVLAAVVDQLLAFIVAVAAAKQISDRQPLWQTLAAVVAFLAYYGLPEALFGTTLGKLSQGLVVASLDGGRCTWRQALIRTLFRLLEVNPLLLGDLPAGISIVSSRDRQRIGDRVAGTVVTPRSAVST